MSFRNANGGQSAALVDSQDRIVVSAGGDPIPVTGNIGSVSATFTRPADTTAYASGDLVANSTTAGSVVPLTLAVSRVAAGSFMLRRFKLKKSSVGLTNASFRVHLFSAIPATITNGDNGVFSVSGADDYLGAFDVTMDRAFTDGAVGFGTPTVGNDIIAALASGQNIYGLIEARGAYTPVSVETFTVTVGEIQN